MTMLRQIKAHTPLGYMYITTNSNYVVRIAMSPDGSIVTSDAESMLERTVVNEIEEYFKGKRQQFSFPIYLGGGTSFQQQVWRELQRIGYGCTATYGDIAERIGNKRASRAVGMACNRNPLLLAVPCHRVVGAKALGGFACGTYIKESLLELEGRYK